MLDNCKSRCECEELSVNGMCDKRFIWNPSNYECECDKLCNFGEYLNYKNCKYRKRLIYKVAEKRSESIDGNEMIYNSTLNATPKGKIK